MSQRERDTNSFLFFIVWVNWPFKISENKREKTWANFSDFSDLPAGLCCRLALSWVLLADGGNYIKLDGCFRINQSIQWEHRKGRWRLWAHRANTACSASTPFTGMERVRRWSYWWRTWLALHYQLFIISFGHLPAGSHALVSLLEGRRWCHSFKSWLVHSGCQLLPTGFLWLRYTTWPEFVDSSVNI